MTHPYKQIPVLALALIATITLYAKPRTVQLNQELKNAKFIGLVTVDGYDGKGNILFHSIEYKDTIYAAIANYYGPDGFRLPGNDPDNWTGNWPFQRETVLIVVDSLNKVSLFAKKIRNDYRFWSPHFTGSIALFRFSGAARKLDGGKGLENDEESGSCWDGCLLPIKELLFESKEWFRWTGMALTASGRAAFAFDFAHSAFFHLEGLEQWDKKYEGRRITIIGNLVSENHTNTFKNWKIVACECDPLPKLGNVQTASEIIKSLRPFNYEN
ncbi:MAG: hypothetical protein WCF67_25180 [Chitinophagaceae bacterium]